MEIKSATSEDVLTLFLEGNLNYHEAKAAEQFFNELIADERQVIFNLKDIHYISNTGLLLFKKISEEFGEKNQTLQIKGASHFIRESFQLAGIDDLFVWLEGGL
ncbi:MAG: STAS domain-containing protein [Candidatus Schekmanbacteria bacterium]|nr:STAS domain-containing protein [Candidatus Schekmanbacteria bacterium]